MNDMVRVIYNGKCNYDVLSNCIRHCVRGELFKVTRVRQLVYVRYVCTPTFIDVQMILGMRTLRLFSL